MSGPAPKRQKTARAGTSAAADGPVEEDKTAREKLKAAGFDPNDVHTARSDLEAPRTRNPNRFSCADRVQRWHNITPMTYFAFHGDLPMCRYLHHVRCATTALPREEHRTSGKMDVFWYPLKATTCERYYEVTKWLYAHGAAQYNHVVRKSTLQSVISNFSRNGTGEAFDLLKWLIVEGALQKPGRDMVKDDVVEFLRNVAHYRTWTESFSAPGWTFLTTWEQARTLFMLWARDYLQPTDSFGVFLLGAMSASLKAIRKEKAAGNRKDLQTSTNHCLGSHSGVLESIGDFVGYVKSKSRIKRIRTFHAILSTVTDYDWIDSDEESFDTGMSGLGMFFS